MRYFNFGKNIFHETVNDEHILRFEFIPRKYKIHPKNYPAGDTEL